jgi:HEAT repeat protein
MRLGPRVALILALAPPPLAMGAGRLEESAYVDAAVRRVERLDEARDAASFEEARADADAALGLAGGAVVPELIRQVRGRIPRAGAATWAWALGHACEALDQVPDDAVAALRATLRAPDWEARLAAASALGSLERAEAAPELAALLREDPLPPFAEAPLLLALAGAGGAQADAAIAQQLARGGDPAWSRLMLAVSLRRGSACWHLLVDALDNPDERVRATAATALLLLAEPASWCEIAERLGREPEPAVRRMLVQALAAGQAPAARDMLALVAAADGDASVREAAAILHESLDAGAAPTGGASSREVRDGLRALAREPQPAPVLESVEAGASLVDLPVLERTMRRLPLRGDSEWASDHARLAQLRARILCASGPDCEPPRGRVGRLQDPAN